MCKLCRVYDAWLVLKQVYMQVYICTEEEHRAHASKIFYSINFRELITWTPLCGCCCIFNFFFMAALDAFASKLFFPFTHMSKWSEKVVLNELRARARDIPFEIWCNYMMIFTFLCIHRMNKKKKSCNLQLGRDWVSDEISIALLVFFHVATVLCTYISNTGYNAFTLNYAFICVLFMRVMKD